MDLPAALETWAVPHRRHGDHHHCTPGFVQVDCPWCSPHSGRFRLGLALNGRAAVCWTCGKQRLGEALALLTGRGVGECLSALEFDDYAAPEERPPGRLVIPDGVGPLRAVHRHYLESRGFDPDEVASVWGVQGIGLAPRLAWRLWIPIHLGDRVVSWTTRAPADAAARRYVNAPAAEEAVPAKTLLYGEQYAGHAVVVHEGPTDVWRTGPGAVATMGLTVTNSQLLRISRHPVRYIALDASAAREAEELCRKLQAFPGKTCLVQIASKDAGCATPEETRELRSLLR